MQSSRIRFDGLQPCQLVYQTDENFSRKVSAAVENDDDDDEHQHPSDSSSEQRRSLEHLDRSASADDDYLNLHIKPVGRRSTNLVRMRERQRDNCVLVLVLRLDGERAKE